MCYRVQRKKSYQEVSEMELAKRVGIPGSDKADGRLHD